MTELEKALTRQLTVQIAGQGSEARLLTLPVDICAPNGSILARGTASPGSSATFSLPVSKNNATSRCYVIATLPNGSTLQAATELSDEHSQVTLDPGEHSPHEWLQWVTPFRSLAHLTGGDAGTAAVRRIGRVWTTLWTLDAGRWKAAQMQPIDQRRDIGMQQFVVEVPNVPTLLQIGGEEVAWRLISLPPGGPVRVALTRNAAQTGDSLEVTVGRSHPDNELIMSYLTRGAVAQAHRLGEAWNAAELMLYEKKQDPVSAAAGAYLLLKSRRLQERRDWVKNLVNWFPHMADGAIVSAALALQSADAKEAEIRAMLNVAVDRGLPIFAMGAAVLVETMAAVHRGKHETRRFHSGYLAAQAYARALCSKGAYFSFYGKSPAEPSWMPIYGEEGQPQATPVSSTHDEPVMFTLPHKGVTSGKFGATRVTLPAAPRTPVSLQALTADVFASAERLLNLKLISSTPQLREVREAALPYLPFETSLKESAPPSNRRLYKEIASVQPSAPREELKVRDESRESQAALPRPRAPRQNKAYWTGERLKHSMTIFDGDE